MDNGIVTISGWGSSFLCEMPLVMPSGVAPSGAGVEFASPEMELEVRLEGSAYSERMAWRSERALEMAWDFIESSVSIVS